MISQCSKCSAACLAVRNRTAAVTKDLPATITSPRGRVPADPGRCSRQRSACLVRPPHAPGPYCRPHVLLAAPGTGVVDHHVGRGGVERLGDGPVNRPQRSSSRQPPPNSPRGRTRDPSGQHQIIGLAIAVTIGAAVHPAAPAKQTLIVPSLWTPHGCPPFRHPTCTKHRLESRPPHGEQQPVPSRRRSFSAREGGAPTERCPGVDDPWGTAAPAHARTWSASRTPYLQRQPVDQVSPDLSATELDMLSRSFRPALELALGAGPGHDGVVLHRTIQAPPAARPSVASAAGPVVAAAAAARRPPGFT